MVRLILAVIAVTLLTGCTKDDSSSSEQIALARIKLGLDSPSAAPDKGYLADWTVVGREIKSEGTATYRYVTYVLNGIERQTYVSTSCFNNVKIGQPMLGECY